MNISSKFACLYCSVWKSGLLLVIEEIENSMETIFSEKQLLVYLGPRQRDQKVAILRLSVAKGMNGMSERTEECFDKRMSHSLHVCAVFCLIVRPDVTVEVEEETQSGTHYQSVSCFTTNAKPKPQISWEIGGRTPSDVIFSVQTESVHHANGTLDLTQVLRFPTHLNDEGTVVCVVQHPALPEPRRTVALVQTFGELQAASCVDA